jgi:dTDP-4-amino-4,6-dideoxygalactose transaminase
MGTGGIVDPEQSAVLGGSPVRALDSVRTTPEVGIDDAASVIEYLRRAYTDRDGLQRGWPVRRGVVDPHVEKLLGGEQAALAAEFADFHAPAQEIAVVPVSSGTAAITIALRALALTARERGTRPPEFGDNVIVPALTWVGTATAALGRFVPRLADVSEDTLCIDPESVERLMDERTAAIVVVHLYNRMAPVDDILSIATPRGIPVIEDCAHAVGARWPERASGTKGAVGAFSLQGSKVLPAGEGGLLVTTSSELAEQMISLATCARPLGQVMPPWSGNERMAGVAAALARGQLIGLPRQNAARAAIYKELDEVAAAQAGVTPLAPQPDVVTPPLYKWAARYDLNVFAGMSLPQLADALSAELCCEVTPTYEPLTSNPLYRPTADQLLHITEAYWREIDPTSYDAPTARRIRQAVLCFEHAVGLDAGFSAAFAAALTKVRRDAPEIARKG